jgi:ATP-binding cassette, subfamily B (MDR/TAP), member 1
MFGISQFSMFGVYALVFYIGAVFTKEIGLDYLSLFRALFAIMFGAYGAGMS